jgi:2-C-methyl-D-erythritol 4-phosphate cytidylyltransferase
MSNYAIIVAGGSGTRMRNALPKQFLLIGNKPMFMHSMKVFQQLGMKIIIVVHADFDLYIKKVLVEFTGDGIEIVKGGNTRFESVRNGLKAIKAVTEDDIVFVHDAARPFITIDLIERIRNKVSSNNCVIPIISIADSVRIVNGTTNEPINREILKIVQTPQAAKALNMQKAFKQDFKSQFTDEASVCESSGLLIELVEGLEQNIKITTPQNFAWANKLLE